MSTVKRGRPKGSRNQTTVNVTRAIQDVWSDPNKIHLIHSKLEDVLTGSSNKDALKAIEILLKYVAVTADKLLEIETMTENTVDRESQLERIKQLTK